ncbi:MAG: PEP-CTERM sorting domain-containing protein [Aquabacterium sp.]|uniref:PEP-CTERM sorting domain-containing protein n=1 Tax=Aquabacterium sp. TaxID=1872578 RepID=UPI0025BCEC07|nr:PEP-CTERM sorting domain-containing protein [Aquabacterium sp.]MBI3384133.1 PEP-CTERM sorting domain-containing protein [Aquabacterium sp.]
MHPAIRLQHIAGACAVLLGLSTAHASVVTTSPLDAGLSGTATLSFNPDLLGALDTGRVSVAPNQPIIQPQVIRDTDGFYSSVSVTAPITSVTYDPSSREIFGVGTSGGLVMTAPALKSVSSGGSLTVTDLRADLSAQTIYATVIGANGVGTLNNMALWNFNGLSSGTSPLSATITGLSITVQGFDAFTKSLGLLSLGKAALAGVTDFGTITSTIYPLLSAPPGPDWHITSVPEPTTYALMGLGLAGLAVARRRRLA